MLLLSSPFYRCMSRLILFLFFLSFFLSSFPSIFERVLLVPLFCLSVCLCWFLSSIRRSIWQHAVTFHFPLNCSFSLEILKSFYQLITAMTLAVQYSSKINFIMIFKIIDQLYEFIHSFHSSAVGSVLIKFSLLLSSYLMSQFQLHFISILIEFRRFFKLIRVEFWWFEFAFDDFLLSQF